MMSAHRDVAITRQSARQWADAMERAVGECVTDREVAVKMAGALSGMAVSMAAL
jgi:hemoglobin